MAVKFWTKEEIATLKELWSRGDTAAAIAKQIGRPRNGVIGQAHRLGLEKRETPIKRKSAVKPVEIVKTRAEKYAGQGFNFGKADPRRKRAPNTNTEARNEKREEINTTAYGEAKPLADLTRRECHWPIGEGVRMLFCGAEATNGSYCEKHHTISKQGKMHVQKYIKPHGK